MGKLILNQGESVLLEVDRTAFWNVNSSVGRLSAQFGTIVITNKRVILYKVSTAKKILLGALSGLTKGNKLYAEIQLNEVTNVETKRPLGMGWNYIISTTSGECYGLAYNENMGKILQNAINSLKTPSVSNDNKITSDEALAKLKKAKDKLELGLITTIEYDMLKSELAKFID